jgi:hypothetical protein
VTRFYDVGGDEVPTASVVACDGASAAVPVHLTMTPLFFGDGPDPLGENLCNFSTMPDVIGNWAPNGPVCLDPPSPSGASTLQWTPGTLTSLTFEYGNPPRTSGGVGTIWNSPEYGGNINWPTSGLMVVGQSVVSNPGTGGRRVRLTHLSGPSAPNGNAPRTTGNQVQFHFGTTDGTTPPTRVRLDFLAS